MRSPGEREQVEESFVAILWSPPTGEAGKIIRGENTGERPRQEKHHVRPEPVGRPLQKEAVIGYSQLVLRDQAARPRLSTGVSNESITGGADKHSSKENGTRLQWGQETTRDVKAAET